MPALVEGAIRKKRKLPGVMREDSDDELGTDDHPWEWIYHADGAAAADDAAEQPADEKPTADNNARKRKRPAPQQEPQIVGARMGSFECYLGDTVLLKAEESSEAWVGIICDFLLDEEGEKAAHFMWFSSAQEIRNPKKRTDFLENELYITAAFDINSLATVNGKANIMSEAAFRAKYPAGKVPRKSKEYGKVFICRRGCNTRTCTYTEEFVWEDIYHGRGDLDTLQDTIRRETKATRRRKNAKDETTDQEYKMDADNGGRPADEGDYAPGTPRTPKKARTRSEAVTPGSKRKPPGSQPATPSSHRRILVKKHLEFTPLATRFLSPHHVHSSPYQLARTQLHVAAVPATLPCREAEFSLVYSHLEAAITDGAGTCIYISGTPGTGKTATVREVVAHLDAAVRADELDDFIFVEINGMKLTDAHQAYSLLWEALRGQRVSPAQALDLLEREFSQPSPRRVPCVVLMDELDQLVTRNQGVMYNFFNWPGLRHSRLIVLAVANTMDLPERTLSNKISSRLGLTRITFPGYNHEQLMRIVQSRLEGVPGDIVDADAVQFAARKVAAVSGDARRALDICRRAVELAEADAAKQQPPASSSAPTPAPETPTKKGGARKTNTPRPPPPPPAAPGRVTIPTIRRAIAEATSSPLQQYLRALPLAARLLLAGLLARARRSGLAESTFGDVLDEMQRAARLMSASGDGNGSSRGLVVLERKAAAAAAGADTLPSTAGGALGRKNHDLQQRRHVRPAGLSAAAVELSGAGIVNLEGHKAERPSKMRLAVGDEEVRMALKDDPEIKALGVVL
ncbi:P-loop containing nucleoside triphosphate hydrolase protein [Staphylotrichum tortipilum]|uniref:Origin recognition complex subunit 1 n=1 Tax=Staphylotrichum tortipilum TaxID=2831512 RepID=A0AAN6MKT4_9PEZI|nr:P-loop containing nucleoside triphosphate hydrolase protein [Staphylotrichum longicolle]